MGIEVPKEGYIRLNHFHGLRLESEDFEAGERYHNDKHKLHQARFHSPGVVANYGDELDVRARRRGDLTFEVYPGYCIDGEGSDIFLREVKVETVDLGQFRLPCTVYATIKFVDEPTEFVVNKANPKYKGHRRILETSKLEVTAKEPDIDGCVELARIALEEGIREITDAEDPANPKAGEIDLRFRAKAGVCGSWMSPILLAKFNMTMRQKRRSYGALGYKQPLMLCCRDIRQASVSAEMISKSGQMDLKAAFEIMRIIASLEMELVQEIQDKYIEITNIKEFNSFKTTINGLSGQLKDASYTQNELETILDYQDRATGELLKVAESCPAWKVAAPAAPPPPAAARAAAPVEEVEAPRSRRAKARPEPEDEPEEDDEVAPRRAKKTKKKKKKAKKDPEAVEVDWEGLKTMSGDLPEKFFYDGKNWERIDVMQPLDKKDEADHEFDWGDYKDSWTNNVTYKYPDGVKMTCRGRCHVGGFSEWTIKNCSPGKDMLFAKRIDYVYGGLICGIHVNGKKVDSWEIEGSDRKARWRNWLFRVDGKHIKKTETRMKQVAENSERDVNFYKLWFYQATT